MTLDSYRTTLNQIIDPVVAACLSGWVSPRTVAQFFL